MKKQCRRKVYKLMNPISLAIEGATITQEAELNKLRIREQASIHAFIDGVATVQNWHDLSAFMNLAETMARAGIGIEVLEACEAMQEALTNTVKRYRKWGKLEMTPSEIAAVRNVYEYHDLQRQSVSRGEYERHIKNTTNRVQSKAPELVQL